MQHRGMGFQVGIAAGTAGAPVIMFEGDVKILLTIKIRRVAADPALSQSSLLSLRVSRVKVSLSWALAGDAGGHHCIFIAFQRLLRLAVLRLETRGVAQH